jgi:hypothetical protein
MPGRNAVTRRTLRCRPVYATCCSSAMANARVGVRGWKRVLDIRGHASVAFVSYTTTVETSQWVTAHE